MRLENRWKCFTKKKIKRINKNNNNNMTNQTTSNKIVRQNARIFESILAEKVESKKETEKESK